MKETLRALFAFSLLFSLFRLYGCGGTKVYLVTETDPYFVSERNIVSESPRPKGRGFQAELAGFAGLSSASLRAAIHPWA